MERYFDIELRIGKGFIGNELYDIWLYGDGFIHIKDEDIEGAISEAYIAGNITDELVIINFYLTKLVSVSEFVKITKNWKLELSAFSLNIRKDVFEVPNIFYIEGENIGIEFWIKQQEMFPEKKEMIDKEIANAKSFTIPYIKSQL